MISCCSFSISPFHSFITHPPVTVLCNREHKLPTSLHWYGSLSDVLLSCSVLCSPFPRWTIEAISVSLCVFFSKPLTICITLPWTFASVISLFEVGIAEVGITESRGCCSGNSLRKPLLGQIRNPCILEQAGLNCCPFCHQIGWNVCNILYTGNWETLALFF